MSVLSKSYFAIFIIVFSHYLNAQNKSEIKATIEKFDFYLSLSKDKITTNLDSALYYGELANKFAIKSDIDSLKMRSTFNIALCQFRKGDYTSSLKNIDSTILIAKKLNNNKFLFQSYNIVGAANCIEDKYDTGIVYFDKSLQVAIKLNDSIKIATAYGNIGRSYLGLPPSQKKNAKLFLLKALSIYKSIHADKSELVNLYRNLSVIESNIDNKLDYINKAIIIVEETNEPFFLADLYLIKGKIYNEREDYQSANKWLEKSLNISKEINFTPNIEATLLALMSNYNILNKYKKSFYYLQEYNRLFDYKKNAYTNQEVYLKVASVVYANQKNYQKAYELAKEHNLLSDSLKESQLNQEFIKYNKRFELEQKNTKITQQKLELAQQKVNRDSVIFIGLLLLLIAIGFYQWYFFNQKKKKQFVEHQLLKEKEMNNLRSNFLENIAHEIRTPITLINGHLSLAKEQLDNKENIVKNINAAISNSNRVLANANEILELLKLEKGKLPIRKTRIQLNSFLRRIFYSFESLAEIKKINLEYNSILSSDIVIESDENRIEKIINNFIANAINFSPTNSKIIFDVIINNNYLTISVTDFGQGIALEEQKNIFKRFYQTPNANNIGGVGVGLSLAKEFATSLKGNISVKSKENKGATFIFNLPVKVLLSEEKIEETKIRSINKIQQNTNININEKESILIVEDNPEMNAYLFEILSNQFNCDIAFNGIEGLQKVQLTKYSLIISDVMMPQMDGFELKKKVNTLLNYTNVPFVFITAKTQLSDKIEGYNLGVDDYITKPFVKEELLVRTKNLLINKKEREKWVKDNLDFINNDKNIENQLLDKIKTIINSNLSNEDFKVTDLADKVAYSQRQLSRLLKKLTGLSPIQYILEIRLQKAYSCLVGKKFATITEVRNYVGMPSAANFSKKFFERFGVKPSEV